MDGARNYGRPLTQPRLRCADPPLEARCRLQTQLATRGCGLLLPSSLQAAAAPLRPARYPRLWRPPAQLATRGCGPTPPSLLSAAAASSSPACYPRLWPPPAQLATRGCGCARYTLSPNTARRTPTESAVSPRAHVSVSVLPQHSPGTQTKMQKHLKKLQTAVCGGAVWSRSGPT